MRCEDRPLFVGAVANRVQDKRRMWLIGPCLPHRETGDYLIILYRLLLGIPQLLYKVFGDRFGIRRGLWRFFVDKVTQRGQHHTSAHRPILFESCLLDWIFTRLRASREAGIGEGPSMYSRIEPGEHSTTLSIAAP